MACEKSYSSHNVFLSILYVRILPIIGGLGLPHEEESQANRIKGTFRGLDYERDAPTISDGRVVT